MSENKLRALKLLTNLSVVEERDLLIEENRKLRQMVTKQQRSGLLGTTGFLSMGTLFGLVLAQLFPHLTYVVGMMYTFILMWAVANVFIGIFGLYIIAYVMTSYYRVEDNRSRYGRRK